MSEEKKLETPATTSAEQQPAQTEEANTFNFNADINQLLSLIINTLTKKNISLE